MWDIKIVHKVLEEPNDRWNIKWLGSKDKTNLFKKGDYFKYEFKDDVIGIGVISEVYKSKEHNMYFNIGKFLYSVPSKKNDNNDPDVLPLAILDHDILILPKGVVTEYKFNFYADEKNVEINKKNPIIVDVSSKEELDAYMLLK
jgi:hypothetical protein